MPEDFYAALMMRRTLPTTTDITTIKDPGIYPVTAGNSTAPGSLAGVLIVLLPKNAPKRKFIPVNSWREYTLVDGNWQGTGTASLIDIVTSMTDTTAGRVPVVGWMGWGGPEIGIPDKTDIHKFFATAASGNYGGGNDLTSVVTTGYHCFKWQQHGGDHKYGVLYEIGSNGGRMAVHTYSNPNGDMVNPQNYWTTCEFLQLNGGTLTGDLYIDKSLSIIYKETAGVTPVNIYTTPWCDTNGKSPYFEVYAVKASDASARQNLYNISFDSSTLKGGATNNNGATLSVMGRVVPVDYTNFDARYYTKQQSDNGYAAKTSVYTKAESDGRYLQDVRLGGQGSGILGNPNPFQVPAGCVMTGWYTEGSNPGGDTIYYKPIQKNKNGSWVTISG